MSDLMLRKILLRISAKERLIDLAIQKFYYPELKRKRHHKQMANVYHICKSKALHSYSMKVLKNQ